MWKFAIEDALVKIKQNIQKHPGKLPHIIEGQRYDWGENNDWIEGFYTGMMWLAYEFGQDPFYKEAAESYLASFKHRLDHHIELDHHDIGFLYSLSAVAQWRVTRSRAARELALQAADALLARWRPKIGVIQAWGKEDDPENGGRIIIDCLLNLPLLFWAHEQTGDAKYYDVAMKHALKSQKFLGTGRRVFLSYLLLRHRQWKCSAWRHPSRLPGRIDMDPRPGMGNLWFRTGLQIYEACRFLGNVEAYGPLFYRSSA